MRRKAQEEQGIGGEDEEQGEEEVGKEGKIGDDGLTK